jgi:small subunit ribosomal protein S13
VKILSIINMFLFRDFTLDTAKEIRPALCKIYGVGISTIINITSSIGLGYPFYLNKINMYCYDLIVYLLRALVTSDVRIKRFIEFNINKYITIGCIRGLRHAMCLPVHGQRTRTNARTQRAKRRRQQQYYVKN